MLRRMQLSAELFLDLFEFKLTKFHSKESFGKLDACFLDMYVLRLIPMYFPFLFVESKTCFKTMTQ